MGSFKIAFCDLKHRSRTPTQYLPYAFTQNGVAMLSSVLRSPRAVQVNIEIMRAFVRMRRLVATPREFAQRIAQFAHIDWRTSSDADQAMVPRSFSFRIRMLREADAEPRQAGLVLVTQVY